MAINPTIKYYLQEAQGQAMVIEESIGDYIQQDAITWKQLNALIETCISLKKGLEFVEEISPKD